MTTLPTSNLERDHILKDILEHIDEHVSGIKSVIYDLDALKDWVLTPVINYDFDPEKQLRGFLKTFKDTPQFSHAIGQIHDDGLKQQINNFMNGRSSDDCVKDSGFEVAAHPSPPVMHHFSLLECIKEVVIKGIATVEQIRRFPQLEHIKIEDLKHRPTVYEDAQKTKVMEVHPHLPFENWGKSVDNQPKYTFVPTTILGIQNLVKYAISKGLRVRCAGYRHSWSDIFGENGQILVSFVNLEQVTTLPDPMSIEPGEYNPASVTELKTIDLQEQVSATKRLCRVGVAVTNEDFRRWAVKNNAWTLPLDVILVEVTIGGVNGPICHGAGRQHKTISDLVRKVEYIDCHGDVQYVDDPTLLKAAAGCFGLLGVITHLTFELDAMTYAVMEPRKVDIGLAIPPLKLEDIPIALRPDWSDSSDPEQQLADAQKDFEKRAADDYYSEWFWFTYQQKAWVNTWNTTTDAVGVTEYPDAANTFLQWIEGWIGGVMTETKLFQVLPGHWQAQLLATAGMLALPPRHGEDGAPSITTALPNALHFRRGVQNMRVRDMEFQIPLPPRKDDPSKPDFTVVQRAWWDVIKLVYQEAEDNGHPSSPMRLTLELRIMGGSDMLMAPQYGNGLGTASIEVLSIPDAVADHEWQGFTQNIADLWMSYGDELNVRPHWAKEWDGLKFHGQNARDYLKKVAYPEQIAQFRDALTKIGKPNNWDLGDLKKTFSNNLWDELVFQK